LERTTQNFKNNYIKITPWFKTKELFLIS